jgi:hypothetical protein
MPDMDWLVSVVGVLSEVSDSLVSVDSLVSPRLLIDSDVGVLLLLSVTEVGVVLVDVWLVSDVGVDRDDGETLVSDDVETLVGVDDDDSVTLLTVVSLVSVVGDDVLVRLVSVDCVDVDVGDVLVSVVELDCVMLEAVVSDVLDDSDRLVCDVSDSLLTDVSDVLLVSEVAVDNDVSL